MKRGWCPGLHTPMPSGDGLLVRVQAPDARLTPSAAHALADAAELHGNGILELTSRGNIQIRGLTAQSAPLFAEAMLDAGLADPTPLLPPPLFGEDPTLHPGTTALVAALTEALSTLDLPAKFAVAIDAGGILEGHPRSADLIIHCDVKDVMAGLDPAIHAVKAASTLPTGHQAQPNRRCNDNAVDGRVKPGHDVSLVGQLVGPLAYPNTQDAAYGLAAPFGQLTPTMLRHAADCAAHHATALRPTPWRVLLLGRVPATARPTPEGWITNPTDPRLRLTACIGAPACASAQANTRTHAATLRPTVQVHVSGCTKGCAHPGPATLTLVGNDGRYDVIHNGRTSDVPTHIGLSWPEALALIP